MFESQISYLTTKDFIITWNLVSIQLVKNMNIKSEKIQQNSGESKIMTSLTVEPAD